MKKIKCIKFPKIRQFRQVVYDINRRSNFVGLDKNGDVIYDKNLPKPKIKFKGLIKLHGTNAGVSYTDNLGLWTQSRRMAFNLNDLDSHMGFTSFVNEHKDVFMDFMETISSKYNINTSSHCITIYGEWCGKGIQKKVSISEIEKSFFIFGIKVSKPDDPDFKSYWVEYDSIRSTENRIYNILDFPTYEVIIDFNNPKLVQNELRDITQKIEDECPVAKELGYSGTGEGVVWAANHKDVRYVFKVKGEKHSVAKVKTLAPVDTEKLNSIQEFVDYTVTRNRFDQGMSEVFQSTDEYSMKKTGDIIRWVINDIMDEESDTLTENNLVPKDVNKHISNKVRKMFFDTLNSFDSI